VQTWFCETAHIDLIDGNAAALKVIQAKGPVPVYDTHRLAKGAGKRSAQGEKAPDMEHRRRVVTRGLNEELSKYYRLAMNKPAWKCPELLSKGKHGRYHSLS